MNKLYVLFIVAALCFASCGSNKKTETLTVASERGDCIGVAPMRCLLVKRTGQDNWEYFYEDIEGFNHESGNEYVIEVSRHTIDNPAADQSSVRYVLEKVVSKTPKTSQGLP